MMLESKSLSTVSASRPLPFRMITTSSKVRVPRCTSLMTCKHLCLRSPPDSVVNKPASTLVRKATSLWKSLLTRCSSSRPARLATPARTFIGEKTSCLLMSMIPTSLSALTSIRVFTMPTSLQPKWSAQSTPPMAMTASSRLSRILMIRSRSISSVLALTAPSQH